MFQAAVTGTAPTQASPSATPAPATTPDSGSAAYRADWRLPSPQPGPAPSAPATTTAPAPANDTDLVARAKQDALLSADVYHDVATPPPGFRVADAADLEKLGLSPEMLEQPGSSFRARVYAIGEGASERYVVAFRGSQTGEDWKNDFEQAAGFNSTSYSKALEIGKTIARSDANVTFTGHSLGGGLASEAAIASGREADTFNAAGLASGTISAAQAVAQSNGRGTAAVQAYSVPHEILTSLQNGGDRAIGGVLGDIVAGPIGGIAGGAILDAPSAYGTHHELPDVRPQGVNWFEGPNPISRHGIDWVLAGAAALH